MRHRITVAVVAGLGLLGAGQASAQVPLHQHVLTTPAGAHEIAQGFCANADNFLTAGNPTGQSPAFQNFHHDVHMGVPGTEAFTNPNNPVSIGSTGC